MKALALLILLAPFAAFAQGPLVPPPGPPAPSMKTLEQIEARTPIESLPYVISTPGSYYFTRNLQFTAASGHAISISSPNVTLDLNGFTLSSTAAVVGRAISVSDGLNNITIRNGIIAGSSTVFPTSIAGFENGIYANASGGTPFGAFRNLTVENMQVSGCRTWGIVAYYGTVTHCTVAANGTDGLIASDSVVTGCIAKFNGGNGITGGTVSSCNAISNGGHGIFSSSVSGSMASSNGKNGIIATSGSVTGCTARGNNTSSGDFYDLDATDAVIGSTKYGTGNVTGSSIDGERRTAINSLPVTISTPGSYYLTKSFQFTDTSANAITINTGNVTLDLGGFTLSSTPGVTGNAISVGLGLTNIVIRNGIIAGNTTVSTSGFAPSQTWTTAPAGFTRGVSSNTAVPRNLTIDRLQVSGCRGSGIFATYGIVMNSSATSNGGGIIDYGIHAPYGSITGCAASNNGTDGISAFSGSVIGCNSSTNGGAGISAVKGSVTNSTSTLNGQDGISAATGSITHCTTSSNDTSAGTSYDLNATDAVVAFTKYGTGNTAGSTLTGNKTP